MLPTEEQVNFEGFCICLVILPGEGNFKGILKVVVVIIIQSSCRKLIKFQKIFFKYII